MRHKNQVWDEGKVPKLKDFFLHEVRTYKSSKRLKQFRRSSQICQPRQSLKSNSAICVELEFFQYLFQGIIRYFWNAQNQIKYHWRSSHQHLISLLKKVLQLRIWAIFEKSSLCIIKHDGMSTKISADNAKGPLTVPFLQWEKYRLLRWIQIIGSLGHEYKIQVVTCVKLYPFLR